MAATYHVCVSSFEGPFDLLLHLIARHKVDIYDIPLAEITDDYLAAIRELEILDLEVATEFLVVAATLIELKAARLLPGEDDPELDEVALEARDLLYARLLDYRIFKEAAAAVAERLDAHGGYVPRAVPLEERFRRCLPEVELPVDAYGLAALAARALAARSTPTVDLSHVQPVRLSVREAAGMVMGELDRAGGRASFQELVAGCRHRIEVIIHFLALLELYKLERVDLEQAASFVELVVQRTGPDASLAGACIDIYEGSANEQVSNA
ncbi:MAG: segregation and condensation protein A [Egibacteraceae bacterium]